MLTKFLRPYHLKLFFSSKLIHAEVISRIENKCIASTSSNNIQYRNILGEYAPKNDQKACEIVAKTLLEKMSKKQVDANANSAFVVVRVSSALRSLSSRRNNLRFTLICVCLL